MNKINTVVIMKMNQMQYFHTEVDLIDIENTLVFNNNIIANLYARVAQIALETIEAQRKHR